MNAKREENTMKGLSVALLAIDLLSAYVLVKRVTSRVKAFRK